MAQSTPSRLEKAVLIGAPLTWGLLAMCMRPLLPVVGPGLGSLVGVAAILWGGAAIMTAYVCLYGLICWRPRWHSVFWAVIGIGLQLLAFKVLDPDPLWDGRFRSLQPQMVEAVQMAILQAGTEVNRESVDLPKSLQHVSERGRCYLARIDDRLFVAFPQVTMGIDNATGFV